MAFPRTYVALRSTRPVSSSSVGEPATATGLPNVTLTWIVSPWPYVPLAFGDETDATLGGPPPPSTSRRPAPGASRLAKAGEARYRRAASPSDRADIEPPLIYAGSVGYRFGE